MYTAVCVFRDLQDNHLYHAGDIFPHDGREIAATRIDELITGRNAANKRLIVQDEAEPIQQPKPRKRAAKTPKTEE